MVLLFGGEGSGVGGNIDWIVCTNISVPSGPVDGSTGSEAVVDLGAGGGGTDANTSVGLGGD